MSETVFATINPSSIFEIIAASAEHFVSITKATRHPKRDDRSAQNARQNGPPEFWAGILLLGLLISLIAIRLGPPPDGLAEITGYSATTQDTPVEVATARRDDQEVYTKKSWAVTQFKKRPEVASCPESNWFAKLRRQI